MKNNFKIKLLIGACIIIVGTLSLIQYYLVLNTYKLTKEKYYNEIRREFGKLIDLPSSNLIEERAQDNLKAVARLYISGTVRRNTFAAALKLRDDTGLNRLNRSLYSAIKSDPLLRSLRFRSQYDEIAVSYRNKTDTLLSAREEPFIFSGSAFSSLGALPISNGNNIMVDNLPADATHPVAETIKLKISQSLYIDPSSWQGEVWKRMAGIYMLAVLLILAVSTLFYVVFRTMLRQKKLAEIKTDFANNITHELKTPLSSVNLILSSLEKKEVRLNLELSNELLDSLKRQYLKIQQTVDFVLESAMNTGYYIEREIIIIEDYLRNYVRDLKIEHHRFVFEIPEETNKVSANIQILDKILNNLIENASKYSSQGSMIRLTGHKTAGGYVIEVDDEGPGIPASARPFIFDKFFRVSEKHNKHTVKGLGLGLYLSKRAAISMKADLILKNKNTRGATFILEFTNEH